MKTTALLCVGLALACGAALGQTKAIVPERVLITGPVRSAGRATFPRDSVERLIVTGKWKTLRASERPQGSGSEAILEEVTGRDGRFTHPRLRAGYASVLVRSETPRIMVLEASGHSMVYVNLEPRMGDGYGLGYVKLPVELHAGENELLFACARDTLSVRLVAPRAAAQVETADATTPDVLPTDRKPLWGAVVVLNATKEYRSNLALHACWKTPYAGGIRTDLPAVAPLAVRKVPFRIPVPRQPRPGDAELELTLVARRGGTEKVLDTNTLKVRMVDGRGAFKRTFLSGIDGSVQYYAVVPPRGLLPGRWEPGHALTLTCHGAGVEAIGQAAAYAPKRGMWIVAPTNRRPLGFDWEEWGRMDAMEVLDLAMKQFRTDPARTYLTGHSMGGHGAWHLSVTFPDRFAAVGPSAGWVSFTSYGGGVRYGDEGVGRIFHLASGQSDTLNRLKNLKPLNVYILHGKSDDTVPVTEARTMADWLREFHTGVTVHEEPGAGHWWGGPSDPGTACVDWPPMFDMFFRSLISPLDETRLVDFTTVNPGVSWRMRWLTILQQQRFMEPSRALMRCDPVGRRFVGQTHNVAALALDLRPLDGKDPITIELDGWKQTLDPSTVAGTLCLRRAGETWQISEPVTAREKGPGRSGPFKEAWQHRFVLVYGTAGTPQENAWAYARARLDAETFWYRGNGSPDLVPDTAFEPRRYRDRSVVLYGHAQMNRAWSRLLGECPVQVRRGEVQIGGRLVKGDETACLFCYPRLDSDRASVAVVAGTGLTGMRLTDRSPYFVSGTAFPDLLAWTPRTLEAGLEGVVAAGFFGNDWSVERGDFVFAGASNR